MLTTAAPPASDLDPSFGMEGVAHFRLDRGGLPEVIEDALGRLLVVDGADGGAIAVQRFTAAGVLDTTFGDDGIVTLDYWTDYESVNDLVLDQSGRIVMAAQGYSGFLPAGYRWLVIRMNPDGTLDQTFGTGGVVEFTPFDGHASPYDSVRMVHIDSQGRIAFGGFARSPGLTTHVAFGRLTNSGAFDSEFGGDGLLLTTGNIGIFASVAITMDSAGRFVAGILPDGGDTLSLLRLSATGPVDVSFGDSGTAVIPTLGRSIDGLVVDSGDGALVAQESSLSFTVRRVSPDGLLDLSYGDDGVFTFEAHGSGGLILYDVMVDPNDRAAVYGDWYAHDDWDQLVVRIRPDGILDSSFSGDGFTVADGFPGAARGSDSTTGAFVDASGRIVTAGSSWNGLHDADEVTYLTLTRYLAHSEGPVAGELCGRWLPTITGTSGDDVLFGTPGDDVIAGGSGNDVIRGLDGNDMLCGGDGDDEIYGGGGYDLLEGDAGNDLLRGGPGDDASYGGAGDDRIQSGPGADTLWGGDGKDKLWGGIGDDQLFGEGGNDQLHGNRDNDYLNGGDGTDRLWGDAGDDRLYGVSNSDFLYGGIGRDQLRGGAGNDRLFGWTEDDELYGEAGRDQLRGQAGDDYVDGGPNHDWCSVEAQWVNCETPL